MPELPEVEVVRRGLDAWVTGRTVAEVAVLHSRSVRRHLAGPEDFSARLRGRAVTAVLRRGKYLWLTLDSGDALLVHLGMSGQILLRSPSGAPERHLRVLVGFDGGDREMRFVDQRTFGHVLVDALAGDATGAVVPTVIRHIARDPLDPGFDDAAFAATLRRRRSEVKRALLDQSLVSGVGNIYADEALWRVGLHGGHATGMLSESRVATLLTEVRAVMRKALDEGGTSFDALYVDVNGDSGYFERGLKVYGRAGRPCERCGTSIRREAFMNRSSYSCPRCQPDRVE